MRRAESFIAFWVMSMIGSSSPGRPDSNRHAFSSRAVTSGTAITRVCGGRALCARAPNRERGAVERAPLDAADIERTQPQ
jgi:hypothetical protein